MSWEHELFASYDVDDRFNIYGGINNLFDERLFRQSTNGTSGAASYNEAGRSLFVSLTSSF